MLGNVFSRGTFGLGTCFLGDVGRRGVRSPASGDHATTKVVAMLDTDIVLEATEIMAAAVTRSSVLLQPSRTLRIRAMNVLKYTSRLYVNSTSGVHLPAISITSSSGALKSFENTL